MTDVFISYSRRDIAFARLLHQALQDSQLETWIDWQDIPPSADWLTEVYEAIEQADSFVFIISPTSVGSEICEKEIAHAAKNNKRLIPIVIDDIDARLVPSSLAPLNWIFFKEEDEAFRSAAAKLVTAIQTDQVWVKEHTRLQNRALEWERREKDSGYLLRGGDLGEAERWLSQSAEKDPQPTALQTQYILASRADATRRQRITMGAVLAGFIIAIGLGIFAWMQRNVAVSEGNERATAQAVAIEEANTRATAESEAVAESYARATAQVEAEEQRDEAQRQRDEAERQTRISLSRALSVQALDYMDIQLDLAALLSAEAYSLDNNLQTRSALFTVVQHGHEISKRYLHTDTEWVASVDFSSDGRFLAITDLHHGIQLWDVTNGKRIDQEGNLGRAPCAVFSPDSKFLATMVAGDIHIWDVTESGLENRRTFYGSYQGFIRTGDGLAFSPDGDILVSAGQEDAIIFWDVNTGSQIGSDIKGHGSEIESIAFSPDGRYIATSSYDDSVVLWDAADRRVLRHLSWPNPHMGDSVDFTSSHNVAFSADSSIVAAGFSDGTIHLWGSATGRAIGVPLVGHSERVFSVAFSPDGSTLISSGYDNLVIFWDLESGEMRFEPFTEHNDSVFAVAFGPGGHYAASAGADTKVVLWEMGYGQLPALHTGPLLDLAFSPVDQILASSADDRTIRFWDVSSGTPFGDPITGIEEKQRNLAFSPDGKILVSTGNVGNVIRFWDVTRRSLIRETITENEGFIEAVAFSPDGSILASGGGGGIIVLTDVNSGRVVASYRGHEKAILSLAFSPDGQQIFSIGLDDEIDIWDLEIGDTTRLELQTSVNPGYSMAFNPDATLLATSTAGPFWSEFMLFDAKSGEMLFEPLSGHDDAVSVIAFNTDLTIIATGSSDHTIRLWDVASGQPIGSALLGHSGTLQNLVFSADGKVLASASREGSIRIWDIDPESWLGHACKIANRNLTEAEWLAYLGEEPYRKTCPDLP